MTLFILFIHPSLSLSLSLSLKDICIMTRYPNCQSLYANTARANIERANIEHANAERANTECANTERGDVSVIFNIVKGKTNNAPKNI